MPAVLLVLGSIFFFVAAVNGVVDVVEFAAAAAVVAVDDVAAAFAAGFVIAGVGDAVTSAVDVAACFVLVSADAVVVADDYVGDKDSA